MAICRKFRDLFDPSHFFPNNNISTEDPFLNVDSFKDFIQMIPFIRKNDDEFIRTHYFQLVVVTRENMFGVIKSLRTTGDYEHILNKTKFLKQVYCKSDANCMEEARYFLSCVVAFPVSEAIVESWGSVIDKVISDKVAFKESSDDSADISEKFVFIKVAGPSAGAVSNRRLFKRALTLMYKGSDYPKHFMQPYGKGLCSKVVARISEGDLKDSIFY